MKASRAVCFLVRAEGRNLDVAADGRFIILKYVRGTDLAQFVLVQGWTTELGQRVK